MVRVPKGVDPGFAYNPGKAWLELHTVPPLDGYDDVLAIGIDKKPVRLIPPDGAPVPTVQPASIRLPPGTPASEAVSEFLDIFGASLDRPAVFVDVAGSALSIGKSLFIKGADKDSGDFKWLSQPSKAKRLENILLMAQAIIEPDEIWWRWEASRDKPGTWLLRRRYLKAFLIEGSEEYGLAVFEWGKDGWQGSTTFMASQATAPERAVYFDTQRAGRRVYKK